MDGRPSALFPLFPFQRSARRANPLQHCLLLPSLCKRPAQRALRRGVPKGTAGMGPVPNALPLPPTHRRAPRLSLEIRPPIPTDVTVGPGGILCPPPSPVLHPRQRFPSLRCRAPGGGTPHPSGDGRHVRAPPPSPHPAVSFSSGPRLSVPCTLWAHRDNTGAWVFCYDKADHHTRARLHCVSGVRNGSVVGLML